MNTEMKRSIDIIDQVVNMITLPLSGMSNTEITMLFTKAFIHKDAKLVKHYISEFAANNRKDFGSYFFSCEVQIIRELFQYHNIDMEPDKYKNSAETFQARISGKSRNEIYPFEYNVTYQFYLMANNNSLQLLKTIVPEAYSRIEVRGMDLFGNGINWSKAWNVLNNTEQEQLVNYVMNDYKG